MERAREGLGGAGGDGARAVRARGHAGAARRRTAGGRLRLRRPPAPWRRSAARACTGSTPRPRWSSWRAGACRAPTCASATPRRCPTRTRASTSWPASTCSSSPPTWSPRCARPAGWRGPARPVIAGVWGRPGACDMLRVVAAVRALGGPPGSAGPSLAEPGVLEGLAARAGLEPDLAFDRTLALRYPDLETFVRRVRVGRADGRGRRGPRGGRGRRRGARRARRRSCARTAASGSRTNGVTASRAPRAAARSPPRPRAR